MNLKILLAVLLVITCQSEQWYQAGNPHFLDQSNVIAALKDNQSIKILKFFSPWCKYCRYIKNYVDNYKSSHTISPNLKFYEFNCQGNAGLFCFTQFQVRAYPVVIVFDEKGERVTRIDGLYPQDTINAILDDYNSKANDLNPRIEQQKAQSNEKQIEEVKQQQKQETQKQNRGQNNDNKEQKKQQSRKQQINQVKASQSERKEQKKDSQEARKKQQKIQQVQQVKQERKASQKPQNSQSPGQQQKKQVQKQVQQNDKGNNKKEDIASLPRIQKQMVNEESVAKESKVDPSNIESEGKFLDNSKDENGSYQFIKYLFYLVGISVGVLYGINIFTSKQDKTVSSRSQNVASLVSKGGEERTGRMRDLQKQILVEQVMDENL